MKGAHNLNTGLYYFHQHDDRTFGLSASGRSGLSAMERSVLGGDLASAFVDEQYKPNDWLTLNGGLRLTHYNATINENAGNPRVGGAVRIPNLKWVARVFYGRYYQAPPLATLCGPVLEYAVRTGFGFLSRCPRELQHHIPAFDREGSQPRIGGSGSFAADRASCSLACRLFQYDRAGNRSRYRRNDELCAPSK